MINSTAKTYALYGFVSATITSLAFHPKFDNIFGDTFAIILQSGAGLSLGVAILLARRRTCEDARIPIKSIIGIPIVLGLGWLFAYAYSNGNYNALSDEVGRTLSKAISGGISGGIGASTLAIAFFMLAGGDYLKPLVSKLVLAGAVLGATLFPLIALDPEYYFVLFVPWQSGLLYAASSICPNLTPNDVEILAGDDARKKIESSNKPFPLIDTSKISTDLKDMNTSTAIFVNTFVILAAFGGYLLYQNHKENTAEQARQARIEAQHQRERDVRALAKEWAPKIVRKLYDGGRSIEEDMTFWNYDEYDDELKITMKITWRGSNFGGKYWANGTLVKESDGSIVWKDSYVSHNLSEYLALKKAGGFMIGTAAVIGVLSSQ